ncbi:MAG: hypothetical protein RLZZ342_750 [Candidatus Parcubacteria bacterium]|jgi:DNA repair protein RecO (recombination protein O)
MYQKYSTDALVLGSREQGEADKVFALYTRDFGLVWARASAVRSEHSKMRAALQSCAHARVSLVRGSRGWRGAGAASIRIARADNPKALAAFARIAELVVRLVRGEDKNEYLFETLAQAHEALFAHTAADVASVEIVCVARVLYALGYLSAEALETTLFAHTAYGLPEMTEAEEKRAAFLASINRAISETQL